MTIHATALDQIASDPAQSDEPVAKHEQPVRLEQWCVCDGGNCPQGRDYTHLRGIVFNHPDKWGCPDGMIVCTSRLVTLNPPLGVTKSRVYHLVGPAVA